MLWIIILLIIWSIILLLLTYILLKKYSHANNQINSKIIQLNQQYQNLIDLQYINDPFFKHAKHLLNSYIDVPILLDSNLQIIFMGTQIKNYSNRLEVKDYIGSQPQQFLTPKSYQEFSLLVNQITQNNDLQWKKINITIQPLEQSTIEAELLIKMLDNRQFSCLLMSNKKEKNKYNIYSQSYYKIASVTNNKIIILDISGNICSANKAFCNIINMEENDIIGKNFNDFPNQIIPKDFDFNMVNNNACEPFEFLANYTNHPIAEKIIVSPIFDNIGIIENYAILKEDISTLKSRTNIFSIFTHDLRNAIGNLKIMANLLSSELNQNNLQKSQEYIEILQNDSVKAFALCENMTIWLKRKFITNESIKEVIDAEKIITNIIDFFQSSISQKNLTVTIHPSNFVDIYAERMNFNNVMRNLIINAIKFSYPNGQIDIYIEPWKENEDYALIKIADQGIGINDEDADKIFSDNELFSKQGTQNEKGMGLGLKISKEIVKTNNCDLWFIKNEPQGTIFCVTVPFA